VRDSVRKRKAQERLARAEKRAAKAAAELKKAQKLAA
jgi:hypothetical protein